jgi:2,4-dienoyl-CoA reductase-like NADH-dependent reductase (Old Yellow Enzyme family)
MPPMVCFGKANREGFVTEKHIKHYEARARGGTGLIIVEATSIQKNGRLSASQLGIWSDDHIEGLSKIASACHKYGSVVILQLHHAGLKTHPEVSSIPSTPWKPDRKDGQFHVLSEEEINTIRDDFIQGAIRAKKAGFDGIELHGAHGYLLNQFASSVINQRTDNYGGSLENRMKLSTDIIHSIQRELGQEFIVGYRMGGNEPTLDDGIKIARILEEAGVDLLHVSTGIPSDNWAPPTVPKSFPFNWIVYSGIEIKKHVSVPVIVVNGIRTPTQATWLVENKLADFVAVGRGMLADPSWAEKAMNKADVSLCLECSECFWFSDGDLCPQQKESST